MSPRSWSSQSPTSPRPRSALHLDHADTLDELSAAINAGFGSVMIDGSTLPFDRHVTLAQSAQGLTTWSRLPLEAELGHVAGDEAGRHDRRSVLDRS